MPAKRKSAKQDHKKQLEAYYAGQEKAAAAHRKLCSHLLFWKTCGHKKCLRAQACVVDYKDCFDRLWPPLPEEVKIYIRTTIKAAKARLSPAETEAAFERDLARWRESIAPRPLPETAAVRGEATMPPVAPRATARIRSL